jgi:hypothetical protein
MSSEPLIITIQRGEHGATFEGPAVLMDYLGPEAASYDIILPLTRVVRNVLETHRRPPALLEDRRG